MLFAVAVSITGARVVNGFNSPLAYGFPSGLSGSQVTHPSFIGDLELRAGGYGAEQGSLIGDLVTMTPATADDTRTVQRANPIEIGE